MKILLLGSKGRLGAALARDWSRKWEVRCLARPELDMADPDHVDAVLSRELARGVDVVVNATGMTNLEQCEDEPELADRINHLSVKLIAERAQGEGIRLIHFGTDYVYDGLLDRPYRETDPPNPQGVYAQSKWRGEEAVLSAGPSHAVFRVSWVFGPDKPGFVDMILRWAMDKDRVEAVADKTSSPSYTEDISGWVARFIENQLPGGLYHACNAGGCSWRDFGQEAVRVAADLKWPLKSTEVHPVPLSSMTFFRAPRPKHTVMDSSKLATALGYALPPWEDAVARFVKKLPIPLPR